MGDGFWALDVIWVSDVTPVEVRWKRGVTLREFWQQINAFILFALPEWVSYNCTF